MENELNIRMDSAVANPCKARTEEIVAGLCDEYPGLRWRSMMRHTAILYNDVYIAAIWYRIREIRLELRDDDAALNLFHALAGKGYAYQKSSANPYSTPGKYSFFASVDHAGTVLRALVDAYSNCL